MLGPWLALGKTTERRSRAALELLIDAGIDVNLNPPGANLIDQTPLDHARRLGYIDIEVRLLEAL